MHCGAEWLDLSVHPYLASCLTSQLFQSLCPAPLFHFYPIHIQPILEFSLSTRFHCRVS